MLSTELIQHYRTVSQQLLTVVDVETTGHLPHRSRVTEISVLQATLADGILQQQTSLVNPKTHIPPRIVEVTGITQAMVDAAPPAEEVFPNYQSLLSQGVLTAHNLEFDYAFLRMEYGRLNVRFVRPEAEQLCTVQLSRLMLPDLPSRRLPDLVRHFHFQVSTSHRAEADAIACWLLTKRLLTEILNTEDAELLARFARQWMPLKYAAQLLRCSQKKARSQLDKAGIYPQLVGRGDRQVWMYRRGDVERLKLETEPHSSMPLFEGQGSSLS